MKPVNALTELQAAIELADLLDKESEITDELDLFHWMKEHGQRIQQLELHIQHLQNQGTAEEPIPQTPIPQELPVNQNEERLKAAMVELRDTTEKANSAPDKQTFAQLAQRCHNIRYKIRDLVKRFSLKAPEFPELPVNPFSIPIPDICVVRPGAAEFTADGPVANSPTPEVVDEVANRQGTLQQVVDETPYLDKAGPGPYTEPDPAKLAEALSERGIKLNFPDPSFLSAYGINMSLEHEAIHQATQEMISRETRPGGMFDREGGSPIKSSSRPEPHLVDHPSHYQGNGIECIDALEAALGPEGFQAYCRGNVMKYTWRAGKKQDTATDMRKAAWYANRAATSLEKAG